MCMTNGSMPYMADVHELLRSNMFQSLIRCIADVVTMHGGMRMRPHVTGGWVWCAMSTSWRGSRCTGQSLSLHILMLAHEITFEANQMTWYIAQHVCKWKQHRHLRNSNIKQR